MSPYSSRAMSQIDVIAEAEHALATARTAMAAPPTLDTHATITHALSRASFLIWAISQEQTDPTAPDARTSAYMISPPSPHLTREMKR